MDDARATTRNGTDTNAAAKTALRHIDTLPCSRRPHRALCSRHAPARRSNAPFEVRAGIPTQGSPWPRLQRA
ncbi:hypothetical protein GCM10010440_08710 [Kitasatospora cinereorecta]